MPEAKQVNLPFVCVRCHPDGETVTIPLDPTVTLTPGVYAVPVGLCAEHNTPQNRRTLI